MCPISPDGGPRPIPVWFLWDGGRSILLYSRPDKRKLQNIAANPKVELCYMDAGHNQVRLTGFAEIVTERPLLEEIWNDNPLMRQFLGSLDNPQLIVYRIRPLRVRYMQEWALEYHEVPLS